MTQAAFPLFLLLSFILLFRTTSGFFACAAGLSWMGGIYLLNLIAPSLPFFRAIRWSYAMTLEIFAFVGVVLLRFLPTKESARGKGQPILLVHGYLNHGSVWLFPKKRLEGFGLGPIYTIHLGHPFRSIRQYAQKVKEKAEKITKETGRKDLVLIGHSMGGLVCSWYATQLAPVHKVTDVITIGTPFFGTPLAQIGLGPNAREMEPDSFFLKELRAGIARKKGIRFYHLATKCDQLVRPFSSALLPENEHLIFEDIGHASLLYSKRVTDQIARWLLRT